MTDRFDLSFRLAPVLALTLVGAAAAAPAAVGSEGPPRLVAVDASPSGLAFQPLVAHDGLVLTISNGDLWLRQRWQGGETPFLALVDAEGQPLPDGTYMWELAAAPRPLDLSREQVENARFAADGEAAVAASGPLLEPQSGAFTILDGALVDPTLVEPESVRGGGEMAPEALATGPEIGDRDGDGGSER